MPDELDSDRCDSCDRICAWKDMLDYCIEVWDRQEQEEGVLYYRLCANCYAEHTAEHEVSNA